jgi:hypothetical protein
VTDFSIAEIVSTVANVATVIALLIAVWQFAAGKRSSSGAAVITLNEAFRQAWARFLDMPGDDPRRYGAFCDVANLVESACALHEDKVFTGRSGRLLERYLVAILRVFQGDPAARGWLARMLHDTDTFEHMGRFVSRHRVEIRQGL